MATKISNATVSNVSTPEMLNAIRAESSEAYQNAVPVATANNLADVGNPIIAYDSVANEFLNTLINKIAFTIVYNEIWENPLRILKKGYIELGYDIEEVQVNPAEAVAYDGTETGMADILKMHKPDAAAVWYRLNRQDKYPVTVNNDQLSNAFVSWNNFESFLSAIVDSLYNGNTIDEYRLTKQLVTDVYNSNKINSIGVQNPVDENSAKVFLSKLRGTSMNFTFPSSNYNNWILMGGTTPRITFSPVDRQILLIRGDVASTVSVEALSAAFNLSYSDYLTRQIIVDEFDEAGDILAVLADERAFQIREKLRKFTTFYNASSLSWQYYYHAWDTFALSPFHNAIVFKKST